jgi:hypothetical protein
MKACGWLGGEPDIDRAWECLASGADVNYKSYVGEFYVTPIGIASANGLLDIVQLLLDAGATFRPHDLTTARESGHMDCVTLMRATRDIRAEEAEKVEAQRRAAAAQQRAEAEAQAAVRRAEAEALAAQQRIEAEARANVVAAELLADEERATRNLNKSKSEKKKTAANAAPAAQTPETGDAAADAALEAAMAACNLEGLRRALDEHADAASADVLAKARSKRNLLKKKASKAAKSSAVSVAERVITTPVVEPTEPIELMCPITNEIMYDPVVTEDGQTYERAAIERWLSMHDTSPLTGKKLAHSNLTPNVMARGLCQRWRDENPVVS